MRLLGIGDNVMDAYLFQNKLYPGGNAVNVAVLAGRFGAQAGYLGILANDAPGRHFRSALLEEGLDLSRLRTGEGRTACNYITIDESGDRHFAGNNGSDVVQMMYALALNRADCDYVSTFDIAHTSIHSLIDAYLPALSHKTQLSMDYSNDGYTHQNIAQLAPLLSFAFFSGGGKSDEEVRGLARYTANHGARTVIVTRGMRGSYIFENGKEHFQQAYAAERVVDALGAGDAFIASFLTAYANSKGDIPASAEAASRFAGKCCAHFGAFDHAMALPQDMYPSGDSDRI